MNSKKTKAIVNYTLYAARYPAFSLVEILIVVAILGILAAVVVPQLQGHTAIAKEAAGKDNLRLLRTTIERYTTQHNEVAPGYYNNGRITPLFMFYPQFTKYSNLQGVTSDTMTESCRYGPYLREFPTNPFNDKQTVRLLPDGASFPDSATGIFGWIYSPSVRTIRLDWPGTDSKDIRYYDY